MFKSLARKLIGVGLALVIVGSTVLVGPAATQVTELTCMQVTGDAPIAPFISRPPLEDDETD